MPTVYVPNTVEAEIICSLHGQTVENTLSFEYETTPDEISMNRLGMVLNTWYASQVMEFLSNEYQLLRTEVTGLESATSPGVTVNAVGTVLGGVGAESLPGQNALCVSFRTALRGRSFRGRNYISGIPENAHAAGVIADATATGIRDAYVDLIAIVSEDALTPSTWVVVSRVSGGVNRASGVTTPVQTATLVDRYVDNQRRRAIGRGM